jgi:hypothetical protein
MKPNALILLVAAIGALTGCNEENATLGPPPPAPEFSINQNDPNNVIFTITSAKGFMVNWDFGNGTLSQKMVDTVYFPFADTYSVSLAVSGKGGATVTEKEVVIQQTDPKICADVYYALLSGGCGKPSKTWVMSSTADSVLGNGPPSPKDSNSNGTSSYNDKISYWWNSSRATTPPLPDARSLDDEYVFALKGFVYKNESHGHFFFNWKWANKLFGASQATYADTIWSYIPNNPATWKLEKVPAAPDDTAGGKKAYFTDDATGKDFNLILQLSNDNYMGYGSGTSTYQILAIDSAKMLLRHELAEPANPLATGPNRLEWRYLNLVAKK